jgi:hypothetical protein
MKSSFYKLLKDIDKVCMNDLLSENGPGGKRTFAAQTVKVCTFFCASRTKFCASFLKRFSVLFSFVL